jgi:catechol 2,3-dioxygenase-like lactoylglutathione lyase family enzyme
MRSTPARFNTRRNASRLALLASSGAITFLVACAAPALSGGVISDRGGTPSASASQVARATSTAQAVEGVQGVLGVGMTVRDLDASVEWYRDVLGFTLVEESEDVGPAVEQLTGVFGVRSRTARMSLGQETIELTQYLAPEGRSIPEDSRSNDRWFQHIAIVVRDIGDAYRHLRAHKVRHASTGPQTLPAWNTNAAGISAFYFKDPDGHVLEVIHFPAGKGDPKWRALAAQSDAPLFLGIDHTAIVVADTRASLAFYQGVLGMRIAGGSENHGDEQAHLNNVEGAHLRITTLKAQGDTPGPGVELLEYVSPRDGRAYPLDARPNDLLHWHTIVRAPSVGATFDAVSQRRRTPQPASISRGVVDNAPRVGTTAQAAMVRDPDGHALLLQGK